ncbi:sensor histidine kinase [Nocardioides sp.]|uniref:sensor histidine kinase n=1 Tax=Nocardioides sp. TaxID=35761 RepID=UPI002734FB40|nr:sensor histidine kinase [Nocardioides sp.]MDP3894122.1 sensor histidine kinase [Nocardioides sp.]
MRAWLPLVPRYVAVAAMARLFALGVIGLPTIALRDTTGLMTVLLLALIWTGATTLSLITRLPVVVALVLEASLITFIVAIALVEVQMLQLTALAVTPLIAGLRRGGRGVVEVLVAQVVVLAAAAFPLYDPLDATLGSEIFAGLMLGLGLGLLAAFLRAVQGPADQLTPYRDARLLIQQLLEISDDLTAGLDPVSISEGVVEAVRDQLPLVAAVVCVRDGDSFTPLLDAPAALCSQDRQDLSHQAWTSGIPTLREERFAIPLKTDAGLVAVVAGVLPSPVDEEHVTEQLAVLEDSLTDQALRLDTALLFTAVRESATSDERQRLAREVHDGIAQEVASLGYFVDAMASGADDPAQAEQFQQLRSAITRAVAEIRRTVFNLRNEAAHGLSLGQRIQAVADQVSTTSGLRIDVSSTEGPQRLRTEVEGELLRIVQEAINNAARHARADRVTVDLTVDAPHAAVVVADNGQGLQEGRTDSHGLRIMAERARRIGASVSVDSTPGEGVRVRVVVAPGGHRTGDE